jgi:hypothetical protein
MTCRPLKLRADVFYDHLGHPRTENLELGAERWVGKNDEQAKCRAYRGQKFHPNAPK